MSAPDIGDEPLLLADFALQDTRRILDHITAEMNRIRTQPNWKSSDLADLKVARNVLQKYLPKATINALTAQEHVELQGHLNHYSALLR